MCTGACMCLLQGVTGSIPRTLFGFLRYLVLYIPIVILALSCLTGAVLAAVEDWAFLDGFFFMAGAIAKLANPLVNGPTSPQGCLVEVLCICIELCIGGAIIGISASHAVVGKFIKWIEGDSSAEELAYLKRRATDLEVMLEQCHTMKAAKVSRQAATTATIAAAEEADVLSVSSVVSVMSF